MHPRKAQNPPPAAPTGPPGDSVAGRSEGSGTGSRAQRGAASGSADTVAVELPAELAGPGGPVGTRPSRPTGEDLLDSVARWPATNTAAGMLQLVPVRITRDLPLLSRWMNDPAVDEFWNLSGPAGATEAHLRAQLEGDGRSVPCLGVLDGVPMSYWEIYRADLDPLARYYPARPHDTGIHLLLGDSADRGRGVGSTLLGAVTALVLDQRPDCRRVLAEPDVRNAPSVGAFLRAGFHLSAEVWLPDKRAALLVRERAASDP
ncbi:GNAT family N-acetyltransferase [Streptomyces oceani]|uniref:GNAT family N-acetyltransferase n=1 Tax=Streptomyces oceani TaxID=1075402 RepID=UPI0009A0AE1C|nr:GNAT family N-acetyltransferase [Streptomyces oceani]